MNNSNIFSRRPTDRKVDFSPSMDELSPSDQARRLSAYLAADRPHVITDKNITDCPDALDALREYSYRKIFTGTSHTEFLALDETDPEHIDWAIRIHEIESSNFQAKRNNK